MQVWLHMTSVSFDFKHKNPLWVCWTHQQPKLEIPNLVIMPFFGVYSDTISQFDFKKKNGLYGMRNIREISFQKLPIFVYHNKCFCIGHVTSGAGFRNFPFWSVTGYFPLKISNRAQIVYSFLWFSLEQGNKIHLVLVWNNVAGCNPSQIIPTLTMFVAHYCLLLCFYTLENCCFKT